MIGGKATLLEMQTSYDCLDLVELHEAFDIELEIEDLNRPEKPQRGRRR